MRNGRKTLGELAGKARSTAFPVNVPNISIDRRKLSQHYQIFAVSGEKGYVREGAAIMDVPFRDGIATAVLHNAYPSGELYILSEKRPNNRMALKKMIEEADAKDTYTVRELPIADKKVISDLQLFRLCLNAASNYSFAGSRFSNTAGHLYTVVKRITGTARGAREIRIRDNKREKQAVCLEAVVHQEESLSNPECPKFSLSMDVKTFTSEYFMNSLTEKIVRRNGEKTILKGKSLFQTLPKYVLDGEFIRRALPSDYGMTRYVERQISYCGTAYKNSVARLGFTEDALARAKEGYLNQLVKDFNRFYRGKGLSIDNFYEIPNAKKMPFASQSISQKELSFVILESIPRFVIDDRIGTDNTERVCKVLKKWCMESYQGYEDDSILFKNGYAQSAHSLPSLVLIHEKDYYSSKNFVDEHSLTVQPAQHITIETLETIVEAVLTGRTDEEGIPENNKVRKEVKNILTECLNELAVKSDLIKGKISLFPWKDLSLEGDWTFAKLYHDSPVGRNEELPGTVGKMKIKTDGSFSIDFCDEYEEAVFTNFSKETECEIQDDTGNICVITKTGIQPVSYYDRLVKAFRVHDEAKRTNPNIKAKGYGGKDVRDTLFPSYIDITFAPCGDDGLLYCVGVSSGAGMKTKGEIRKAPVVRMLRSEDGRPVMEMFERFAPAFSNVYVRNGQLSVLPFPVHYLDLAYENWRNESGEDE